MRTYQCSIQRERCIITYLNNYSNIRIIRINIRVTIRITKSKKVGALVRSIILKKKCINIINMYEYLQYEITPRSEYK
jgi:hypothetical protein